MAAVAVSGVISLPGSSGRRHGRRVGHDRVRLPPKALDDGCRPGSLPGQLCVTVADDPAGREHEPGNHLGAGRVGAPVGVPRPG
jgi:hypothetical protein